MEKHVWIVSCVLVLLSPAVSSQDCKTDQHYACTGIASYKTCGVDEESTFKCSLTNTVCVPGLTTVTAAPTTDSDPNICQELRPNPRPKFTCKIDRTKFGLLSTGTENCKYFYHCTAVNQGPILGVCSDNLHFSVKDQNCQDASTAGCKVSDSASSLLGCAQDIPPGNFWKLVKDPNHCNQYMICNHQSTRIPLTCPDNLKFDSVSGTCNKDVTCTTTGNPTTPTLTCTSVSQKFADPTNCKKYYECKTASGTPTLLPCNAYYYYDEKTTLCSSNITVCNGRPTNGSYRR